MRILLAVRESIVWILKLLFERQLQSYTERIRLSVPLFWLLFRQRMRWFDDIVDPMDMSLSKLQAIVKVREAWNGTVHGVTESDTT